MKIKQTAGRDALNDFAPKFAQLNDDVLFGEVWSRDELPLKMRSILTISVLVGKGLIDMSFQHHLAMAKKNGVTKTEMAEILTHLAFYAGWPNAWAAFRLAKEVYQEDDEIETHGGMFGLGEPNTAFAKKYAEVFDEIANREKEEIKALKDELISYILSDQDFDLRTNQALRKDYIFKLLDVPEYTKYKRIFHRNTYLSNSNYDYNLVTFIDYVWGMKKNKKFSRIIDWSK